MIQPPPLKQQLIDNPGCNKIHVAALRFIGVAHRAVILAVYLEFGGNICPASRSMGAEVHSDQPAMKLAIGEVKGQIRFKRNKVN